MHHPSKAFNLEMPTFREVKKIINKMKLSGSPCPLDHVSVLMLKNVPFYGLKCGEYVIAVGQIIIFQINGKILSPV